MSVEQVRERPVARARPGSAEVGLHCHHSVAGGGAQRLRSAAGAEH